jgi:3-hydroxybutyryl-CoA dehydrogenase
MEFSLRKVGVIGAGMMGSEIALCFAMANIEVILKDINLELAKKGKDRSSLALDKLIKKGHFSPEERELILSRIAPTENDGHLKEADLIVEAVIEDSETKKSVFRNLDATCKPECIFASNTSSISITQLATSVGSNRIGQFLGAHFFSPASVMKLVEVIPGLETKEDTVSLMMECFHRIGKTPIRVKDVVGFVVNRLLHAMWIEANRLVEEGVASPEDIDIGCKLGLGHPIGPYGLMDLTGNDLNLKIQEILFEAYGERFKPRPILRQKVFANHLGRKTGRGWFDYRK